MKIIGRIFDGLVLAGNVVVIIIFIIASYSDYFSPDKSLVFPYLGLLFPFFLVAVICFAIYWIMRGKLYAVLSIVALLVCYEPSTRYFPLHFSPDTHPEKSIKLLTYNTQCLGKYNINDINKPNDVLRYIKESDADIVCLQEYAVGKNDKGWSEKNIRKYLPEYKYYKYNKMLQNGDTGLAIFSKYPVKKVVPIEFKKGYITSMAYEVDIEGRRVTIINNHLESNRLSLEDRAFYDEMIRHFNTTDLAKAKSTLMQKLSSAYIVRALQAEKVAEVINKTEMPVIVCGDFNDTPISYSYQTIRGGLTDAFKSTGLGPGITYHENKFLFRIDHIFHSPSFRSYEAKVDRVKYSDHYPVTVYLEFQD